MIQVKRNSVEFKTLKGLLDDAAKKSTRKKYLLLYSLHDGTDLEKKILINTADKSGVVYDLTLQNVLTYMRDRRKKLFRNERSAFYVFKNAAKDTWMEFPFELKGPYKKELFPLTDVK